MGIYCLGHLLRIRTNPMRTRYQTSIFMVQEAQFSLNDLTVFSTSSVYRPFSKFSISAITTEITRFVPPCTKPADLSKLSTSIFFKALIQVWRSSSMGFSTRITCFYKSSESQLNIR